MTHLIVTIILGIIVVAQAVLIYTLCKRIAKCERELAETIAEHVRWMGGLYGKLKTRVYEEADRQSRKMNDGQ